MKHTFYLLTLMLLTLSCNSDDDNSEQNEPTLYSSWSLVNVSGGLAGANDDFEMDLITWDFDEANLELTVTNNNTANVIYDGLPSGTYDYEVPSTTNEVTTVVIDNINYVITTLTNSQLILDEGVAVDGFLLTFSQ
ncbi:hypothetical protein [uncultured Winogradskyella sp.]|uniref:hypothetical protein n=1 Tax=uncultured Winogradskyella sp. TaxID=395353 RepID=UPI0026032B64|nr:hypothetical protein [uncultured Winogradskyella sp.]|tara:strand:- start:9123 stop:9530 length:408 start_codon:yes stop_codon:yes gene_type:complete